MPFEVPIGAQSIITLGSTIQHVNYALKNRFDSLLK